MPKQRRLNPDQPVKGFSHPEPIALRLVSDTPGRPAESHSTTIELLFCQYRTPTAAIDWQTFFPDSIGQVNFFSQPNGIQLAYGERNSPGSLSLVQFYSLQD